MSLPLNKPPLTSLGEQKHLLCAPRLPLQMLQNSALSLFPLSPTQLSPQPPVYPLEGTNKTPFGLDRSGHLCVWHLGGSSSTFGLSDEKSLEE